MAMIRLYLLPIFPLLVSLLILHVGHSLTYATIPLAVRALDDSAVLTGLVGAGFFLGFAVGSQVAVRLVGRVGHIRVFAAGAAAYAAMTLVAPIADSVPLWLLTRTAAGFAYAMLVTISEAWLSQRSDANSRGMILSAYIFTISIAFIGGQFTLPLFSEIALPIFVLIGVSMCIALLPLTLSTTAAPEALPSERYSLIRLYRASPLGMVGCLASGALISAFLSFGPLVADPDAVGTEVDTAQVGTFMAAFFIGSVLLQMPIGRLTDRFDRRTVFLVLAATAGGITAFLGFAAQLSEVLLLILVGLAGGIFSGHYPTAIAHTNDFIEDADRVPAAAACVLAYGVGSVAGPLVTSAFVNAMGIGGYYMASLSVSLGLVAFILYRMTRRASIPLEEQGESVAFAGSPTAFVTGLDPYAEAEEQLLLDLQFEDGRAA